MASLDIPSCPIASLDIASFDIASFDIASLDIASWFIASLFIASWDIASFFIVSCAYAAEPAYIRQAEIRAAASLFIQGSKKSYGLHGNDAASSATLINQLPPN